MVRSRKVYKDHLVQYMELCGLSLTIKHNPVVMTRYGMGFNAGESQLIIVFMSANNII